MSDPLGALSEGATPPHKTHRDPSVSAPPPEVFRRRLLATRTQSLIVNPNDGSTPAPPPPPPPPEYAPPSPPQRGTIQGYPGGKAPIGLITSSSDGGRAVSQLIPTVTAPPSSAPKSFAAAAAAVEQRLLHKSLNGSGAGNGGDPQNGNGVTSPLRHSIGYRPRQRQASTDASGRQVFLFLSISKWDPHDNLSKKKKKSFD